MNKGSILVFVFFVLGLVPELQGEGEIAPNGSGEVGILYDGRKMNFPDDKPIVLNGRIYLPLRSVSELLNCEMKWNAETKTVSLIPLVAVRNPPAGEKPPVPAVAVPAATVPAATVPAAPVSGKPVPPPSPASVTLGEVAVWLGQKSTDVIAALGNPNRKENSLYGMEWHVYNADYSKFLMVGYRNGLVGGIYTNSKGFQTGNGIAFGRTATGSPLQDVDVRIYKDPQNDNAVHAVLIIAEAAKQAEETTSPDFLAIQAMECFDATNAFRVNQGRTPFLWDETGARASAKHSQDMADKDYFSHTSQDGRTGVDRYSEFQKRNWTAWGENISAGRTYGVETFDGWVNSPAHRANMLNPTFRHLGIGCGYNAKSKFRYYATESFITY